MTPRANLGGRSYGHLSAIDPNLHLGDTVTSLQLLGYSGETGYTTNTHLHVTAFYSEDSPDEVDAQWLGTYRRFPDDVEWYFTSYDSGISRPDLYGQATNVNPLILWPAAQHGTICPFWKFYDIAREG
jgi:murein DD-endopeptidase MepM/ murein hydrolase activator NlpD